MPGASGSSVFFSLFVPMGVSGITVPERGSLYVWVGVVGIVGVLRGGIGERRTLMVEVIISQVLTQVREELRFPGFISQVLSPAV